MIGPIWIDESIPSRGGSELYEIFDTTPQIWRQYTDWPLMVAAMIFLVAYPIQVIANLSDNQAGR